MNAEPPDKAAWVEFLQSEITECEKMSYVYEPQTPTENRTFMLANSLAAKMPC